MKIKIILILAMVQAINATQTLAVLEIIPKTEVEVSISEMQHLTDELRRSAAQTLPDYSVLTRDHIISLLPQDEKEAERLAESSAIEIGRAIKAEYISQGRISLFGENLSLAIELYESESGKFIGSVVMEAPDIRELLQAIREQIPALFAKINKSTPAINPIESPQTPQAATPDATTAKIKTSTWIAIGLDVLGATMLSVGIYQHSQHNKLKKDYKNMIEERNENRKNDYDRALKKANDAKDIRDIGFIVGGALLAAGIGVHIWF